MRGADELWGGRGVDFYAGDATVRCVATSPRLIYPGPGGEGDTVDLPGGKVITAHGDIDLLHGIEGAYGTYGQDKMIGDEKSNRFYGQVGSDTLTGAGGNDFLDGGPAVDAVDGGAGIDTCRNVEGPVNCESRT